MDPPAFFYRLAWLTIPGGLAFVRKAVSLIALVALCADAQNEAIDSQ